MPPLRRLLPLASDMGNWSRRTFALTQCNNYVLSSMMQVKERKKVISKTTQLSSQAFCRLQIIEMLIKEKLILIKLYCNVMGRCNSIYTGYKETLNKHV